MKNIPYSRTVFVTVALSFALSSASASAELKNQNEAIGTAGKQCTLSQQMLKNYSLIAMKARQRKAGQELMQSAIVFDAQLADLKKFSTDAATQQQLATVDQLWQATKDIYAANADKAQLPALNGKTDSLLNACVQLRANFLEGGTDGKGALLNAGHTEQMLIERIVALSVLKAAGITGPYQTGYSNAVSEFEKNIDFLQEDSRNTIKLRAQLTRVKKHFKRLNQSVAAGTDNDYSVLIVAAAAEKIAREMDTIILGYQQLKLD